VTGGGTGDRANARATAKALRRLIRTIREVAAWQRERADALREVADAYIEEADANEISAAGIRRRDDAARLVTLAEHARAAASVLDQQAALAVSWAADADERAGERRRGRKRR
jgi:hypothetical protein